MVLFNCLSPCQWAASVRYKSRLGPAFQLLNEREIEDLAQSTTVCAPLSVLLESIAAADGVWHDWGTRPVLQTASPREASTSLRTLVACAAACYDLGPASGVEDGVPDPAQHPIESAVARACATIDPSLGRRFPGQVVEGSVPWTSERRWSCHRISSWGLSDRWGTCSIMSGEAERVLERCSTVLQRGEFVFLGERERQRLQRELAEVSRAGLLAVGVAFLPIPPAVSFPPRIPGVPSDFPTSGLSFAGYFTVRWRPRRDAGESLALAARSAVRLLLTTHHPLPWVHAVLEDSDLATAAPENASLVAGAVVSAAEVAHDPWNIKSEVLHRRLAVVAGLQGGALPRVLAELAAQGDGTLVIGTGADDLDAMRAGRGVAWGGPLPGVPPHEAEGAVRGYVTDRNLSTAIEAVAEARKLVGGALWWPEAGPGPCGDPDDAARSRPFAGPPYPYMHR